MIVEANSESDGREATLSRITEHAKLTLSQALLMESFLEAGGSVSLSRGHPTTRDGVYLWTAQRGREEELRNAGFLYHSFTMSMVAPMLHAWRLPL